MANQRTPVEVDPTGPVPIYHQLKQLLLDDILSGELGPGDRLPTEYELVDRYGVSRTPVTRALTELAAEGVIVRHRRRGSFVNPQWQPVDETKRNLRFQLQALTSRTPFLATRASKRRPVHPPWPGRKDYPS